MPYLTLEYNGTEKQLADWGFDSASAELQLVSQEIDTLKLAAPSAKIDDPTLFPFEASIIFRRNRASAGGLPNTFSGGAVEFQGKRSLHVLDGRPDYEGTLYQFGGPWYDIEKVCYQQHVNGWSGAGTGLVDQLFSDVFLFYDAPTDKFLNTGQQLTKILQHVLTMYSDQGLPAPFQLGTVSGGIVDQDHPDNGISDTIDPRVNVPHYPVRDIMCSEAITNCLRTSPDATVYFDYSLVPPQILIKKRANLVPTSLTIGAANHKSIKLTPRPDLVPRAVVILFKVTGDDNGVTWVQYFKQKYGPNGANSGLDPEGGLRVVVQTLDMQGSSRSDVHGNLVCEAVLAKSPTASVRLAWWKKKIPKLINPRFRNVTISDAFILDADYNDISDTVLATYPNELVGGSGITPWMRVGGNPVIGLSCTIKASMSYDEYDREGTGTQGILKHKAKSNVIHCKVKLTNGVTGNYSAIESLIAGEEIPDNLARDIYQSLQALQYEGEDIRFEEEITSAIGMRNILNLTGGVNDAVAWATMKAQIQSIHRNYGSGMTSVTVGPAKHLNAGDMKDIFLFNRFRQVYYNPAIRNTGQFSSGQIVELQQETQLENSTDGVQDNTVHAVSDDY